MSDVPVDLFVSAQDAQLAMWTAYCDKKMECDDLSEQLTAEREVSDKLEKALLNMKRDTWHWQQIHDAALAEVAAIRAGGKQMGAQ